MIETLAPTAAPVPHGAMPGDAADLADLLLRVRALLRTLAPSASLERAERVALDIVQDVARFAIAWTEGARDEAPASSPPGYPRGTTARHD